MRLSMKSLTLTQNCLIWDKLCFTTKRFHLGLEVSRFSRIRGFQGLILKVSGFQSLMVLRFQVLNVSKFQSFEVSRNLGF
jgi:hypothetical protein